MARRRAGGVRCWVSRRTASRRARAEPRVRAGERASARPDARPDAHTGRDPADSAPPAPPPPASRPRGRPVTEDVEPTRKATSSFPGRSRPSVRRRGGGGVPRGHGGRARRAAGRDRLAAGRPRTADRGQEAGGGRGRTLSDHDPLTGVAEPAAASATALGWPSSTPALQAEAAIFQLGLDNFGSSKTRRAGRSPTTCSRAWRFGPGEHAAPDRPHRP